MIDPEDNKKRFKLMKKEWLKQKEDYVSKLVYQISCIKNNTYQKREKAIKKITVKENEKGEK